MFSNDNGIRALDKSWMIQGQIRKDSYTLEM